MLSVEQAVGRLIVGRVDGTTLGAHARQALASGRMGGVTLFKDNARDLEQLSTLCRDIIESSLHTPVLTVDQEGGAVQRFDHVLTPLPSPMALASTSDLALRQATAINARQLKLLGFNLLLAPTLDLLTNPRNPIICTRAFGDDPALVTRCGLSVIREIEKAGLRACGKHFPGHGSCSEDSHLALAVVHKSLDELLSEDLAPFAGVMNEMSAILVGHIWLSSIDKNPLPASLSPAVVQGILRERMGFTGLIVSDDMVMKGLTSQYGLSEACVRAIEAGLDLLLVCASMDETLDAHAQIVKAVKSGRISEERIAASIKLLDQNFAERPVPLSGEPEALTAFLRQIELDDDTVLELSSMTPFSRFPQSRPEGDWLAVLPAHPRYTMPLADMQEQFRGKLEELRYTLDPDENERVSIVERARGKNVLYFTFRAHINKGQAALAGLLPTVANEFAAVAMDSPYDLTLYSPETVVYACKDPSDLAMRGLARVFAGSEATGDIGVNGCKKTTSPK